LGLAGVVGSHGLGDEGEAIVFLPCAGRAPSRSIRRSLAAAHLLPYKLYRTHPEGFLMWKKQFTVNGYA
jgi:hypothetical protein